MDIYIVEEIPFDDLDKIGISKKAFLNLPVDALDKLMTGRLSPLFQLKMEVDGHLVTFYGKIAFEKDHSMNVILKVFPLRREIDDSIPLTEDEKEELLQGLIIRKNIMKEGKKTPSLVQLDMETNTLMSVAIRNVYIPKMIAGKYMTREQTDSLKAGKPIEVDSTGKKVSVGVDLHSKAGLLQTKGDLGEWRKEQLMRWDIANPGVRGYWTTSENNWQYFVESLNEIHKQDTNLKLRR